MSTAKKTFKITIPKPCSAEWDAMTKQDEGRFCQQCNKVVIDFSQLSDKELYLYFSTAKTIPCGRFHNSQLDSNLIPVRSKKYPLTTWYKSIAAILTILSLKNTNAINIKTDPTTIQPKSNKKLPFLPGKVSITGIVKNHDGTPLENARIKIDEKEMASTDKEGKFEFELDVSHASQSYTLVFTYPGLIRTARSYHAAMLSTSYNVILEPPEIYYEIFQGMPLTTDMFPGISIDFNKKQSLSKDIKNELAAVATKMRQNPDVKFNLVGYANTQQEKALAKKRQDMIKEYLVEAEGISQDRLINLIYPGVKENKHLIEIITAHGE